MFTSKSGGPVRYEAEASTSTLTGNAGISGCTLCSGGAKIGNIGYDASVTLNDITVPTTGTYLVKIAYTDGDTSRQSMLTVNDADSYWVNYHGLGDNDWGTPQVTYLPMKLPPEPTRSRSQPDRLHRRHRLDHRLTLSAEPFADVRRRAGPVPYWINERLPRTSGPRRRHRSGPPADPRDSRRPRRTGHDRTRSTCGSSRRTRSTTSRSRMWRTAC